MSNRLAICARYEKTFKGFPVRTYQNMRSRVNGLVKPHLYEGKDLLDKAEFMRWALADPDYALLHRLWELSGYDRKMTPSIDRINTRRGYVMGNIHWTTHSENSRRGGESDRIVPLNTLTFWAKRLAERPNYRCKVR